MNELELTRLIAEYLDKRGLETTSVHEEEGAFQDADIIAYGYDRAWIIEVKRHTSPTCIRKGVEQLIKRMQKYTYASRPVFLLICCETEKW